MSSRNSSINGLNSCSTSAYTFRSVSLLPATALSVALNQIAYAVQNLRNHPASAGWINRLQIRAGAIRNQAAAGSGERPRGGESSLDFSGGRQIVGSCARRAWCFR
jgi:hypothetical protein